MTGNERALTALITCALAAAVWVRALPAPAGAAPASPPRIPYPEFFTQPPAGLGEATKKAADLQKQVGELQAESAGIQARIKAVTGSIYRQSIMVEAAQSQEASAQARFDERIVGMYKAGATTPIELILSAPTFHDAVDRGIFLLTIAERDQDLLHDASRVSSDAAYQAQVLDELRAQQVSFREAQDQRVLETQAALERQQQLVAQLNEQQKQYLADLAAWQAAQNDQWKNSSYYGSDVPKVPAQVLDFPGVPYLVDQGEPLVYRTTTTPRVAVCSWYGNQDNSPTPFSTASRRVYNENEFTCACQPDRGFDYTWGTWLALSYNGNHVIVVVTDHGPYHRDASGNLDRDLDLSKAAAHALGYDGVANVTVQTVEPQ